MKARSVLESPGPRQVIRLSDTPAQFSVDDMRLFHHYIVAAYPSIPLEYENIWTRDIPSVSHHVSIYVLIIHTTALSSEEQEIRPE